MTLNNILNEVNVEFGNGQSLAVIDALKQRTTLDKTGGYTCRWKTSIKGRLLYNLLLWRNNRIYGFGTGSVLTN